MDQLFSHWEKHLHLPDEVKTYFRVHARFKTFQRGSIISQPYVGRSTWAYVTNGLVSGIYYNELGNRRIRWFAPRTSFFTSTKHLFSSTRVEFIETLQTSTFLEMDRAVAQKAQQNYPSISELFHILKHRRFEQYRQYVAIIQEETIEKRYERFIDTMPQIADLTTIEQQCQYLGMSTSSYYTAQKAYLLRN